MTIYRTMRRRPAWLLLLFAFLIFGAPQSASAQEAAAPDSSDALRLTINAEAARDTISRHIYGLFAEHLGRDIYGGFWVQSGEGGAGTDAGTAEAGPPTGPPSGWQYNEPAIEALRQLEIPNLRWPGGCFADYYHWRDGIGPHDERPTMVNTIWGGVTEDNSFGTHEFLELAERLGTEPFIVGNVGSGTVEEMANWWEYVNHPGGSSLAEERAENGRQEPWNVRFWGVGNESWGCGGTMTPEYYAEGVHLTMTNIDPNQPRTVTVALSEGLASEVASGRVLTAEAMQAHNTFEAPETIAPTSFDGAQLDGGQLTVELPPMSIVALKLR